MSKDFDAWSKSKKELHQNGENKLYHERELWWCTLGVNIGFEQDGSGEEFRRPVLVIKGLSRKTCFVVPLTSATHSHPLRPSVGLVDGKEARALLSQSRVVDTKRFVRKIGYLDKEVFENIRKAVKELL